VRRRAALFTLLCLALTACTPALPVKPQVQSSVDSDLDLMFHNKYSAAADAFRQLIKQQPDDAKAHAAYALLLNYETKLKEALTEATRAQQLAPKDGYVLTILTRVEDWNDDLQSASTTGAKAIAAAPDSVLARAFYAEALADVGRYPEAKAQLQKAASLATNASVYEKAEVERNWGNYYRDQKDYNNALTHLKLAAGTQPDWVERLLELARFAIGRDDLSSATSYLQRAAQLSPDDPGLREQLGEVAIFAQDFDVAKQAYTAALRLQPRSALDLRMLADVAVARDRDQATALKDDRAALQIDPTDQEAGAYLVAVLRYLQSDPAAALDAARHTVAPQPSESTAPSASANSYVDLDQVSLQRQTAALAEVNRYRQIAGLAPVALSAIIHQSALSHAFYTFFNGASPSIRDLGIHREVSGNPGYTGNNVLDRARHFGYPDRSMAEVITHRSDPASGVSDWIDSVFHRIPILRADLLELGFGDAYLGPLSIQVMDMAYREQATTNRVVLYPAPNQTGVPSAFSGNEIPDPAPNATYPIGYPITATFDRFASVTISAFHLRDPSGSELSGFKLNPDNPDMENSFGFMAKMPLKPGTTYSASLSGTINGVAFLRHWQFTTASSSSAATSPSPGAG
jgi:tetratricopeptide (TPR) repeat protein